MRHLSPDPVAKLARADIAPIMAERRGRVRFRCHRIAAGRAFITNSFRSLPARIVDLSLEGIGLLLPEALSLGTRLIVELEGHGAIPFEMLAEVCNVTAQPDGSWRCGCALVFKLGEDELRLLLKTEA